MHSSKDFLYGRFSALHALQNPRRKALALFVQQDLPDAEVLNEITELARERRLEITTLKRTALERKFSVSGKAHQGVVLIAESYPYQAWEHWLPKPNSDEIPFVVVLDHIQDPHNLGALIRTAELSGAQGLIIPKDRAVGVTTTVVKTSAGASELLPIDQVVNLNQTLDSLRERGLITVGLETGGDKTLFEMDFRGPLALVIGSEHKGIAHLTQQKCDHLTEIPMRGNLASLNASVAAGIAMFEVVRQRLNA